jgi:hypothetical protein
MLPAVEPLLLPDILGHAIAPAGATALGQQRPLTSSYCEAPMVCKHRALRCRNHRPHQ